MYKNHNKLFGKEEDKFIIDNYQTMACKQIGILLGRKDTSICDRARKLKLIKIKKDVWTKKEIKLLVDNYNKTPDVFNMFPTRTRNSISYKAWDLGLKKHDRGAFAVNFNYFKTWSSDMSYILGMICADGNVIDSPKRLTITLHRKDNYMLENINQLLESKRPIYKRESKCNDLVLTCGEIVDDLNKLGVMSKKSLVLEWLKVPDEYLKDFVRGYIDGDGCVCTYIRHRYSKDELVLEVSVLGTENFLNGMSSSVSNAIGIKAMKVHKVTSSNIHVMKWSGSTAKKLLQWIYSDSQLHLTRKRKVFEDYLQQILALTEK